MSIDRRTLITVATAGAALATATSDLTEAKSANLLESHRAPIHIAAVSLKARDLKALAEYYEKSIGLDRISETPQMVSLGSGGVTYLHLVSAPTAKGEERNGAGLFHTAFLMPGRAELGAWFKAAYDRNVSFDAASDHGVSEAFYLTDPEGNGIEVYCDRKRREWPRDGQGYDMTTGPMDVTSLVESGTRLGKSRIQVPAATRVGHVHLKVGDIATAEHFYSSLLGLDVTHRRPGGSFFSSGGYHHHIATNTWASHGAVPRTGAESGLLEIALRVTSDAAMTKLRHVGASFETGKDGLITTRDPWAVRLAFIQGVAV